MTISRKAARAAKGTQKDYRGKSISREDIPSELPNDHEF